MSYGTKPYGVSGYGAEDSPAGTTLSGASSTQSNDSTTGAIGQTHVLAGANCTQANASSAGAIVDSTVVLTGNDSTQSNGSTTGGVSQTHLLSGANCGQSNASSVGDVILGSTIVLDGANCNQANGATSGGIAQTHILIGSNATQANSSAASGISQTHLLTGSNTTQLNAASTGAISFPGSTSLSPADIDAIATAVWAKVLEGLTAEEMMRIMFAAMAGKREGIGSAVEYYMAADGVTPRITFAVDVNGNGTPVVNGSA